MDSAHTARVRDPARSAQVRERFATLLEYESVELAAPQT
jgi:hypothetical protein